MGTIETYARPTWLYRYRSLRPRGSENDGTADLTRLNRELDAIAQGYVWCSTFKQMNDPMEGFYRSNTEAQGRPAYDLVAGAIYSEKLGLGLASFSETWNNELMWAHYADGFRGICIAYPLARLLRGLGDQHTMCRVAYGDRPHYLNLSEMHNTEQRARAVLSSKNLKWAYEREWRLFSPQTGPAVCTVEAVATVFLGMRMKEEDRKLIRRRLKGTGVKVVRTLADGYSVKMLQSRTEEA